MTEEQFLESKGIDVTECIFIPADELNPWGKDKLIDVKDLLREYAELKVKEAWDKGFSTGYACACAVTVQQHGVSTEVTDCFRENFMDLAEMKKIGVDPHDIEQLKPIVKEIKRRRKG